MKVTRRYVVKTNEGRYLTNGYSSTKDIQRARIWTIRSAAEASVRHRPEFWVVEVGIVEIRE